MTISSMRNIMTDTSEYSKPASERLVDSIDACAEKLRINISKDPNSLPDTTKAMIAMASMIGDISRYNYYHTVRYLPDIDNVN